ncbi:hypothetical protein EMCRGX_G024691 [Ephydatia muelleri]
MASLCYKKGLSPRRSWRSGFACCRAADAADKGLCVDTFLLMLDGAGLFYRAIPNQSYLMADEGWARTVLPTIHTENTDQLRSGHWLIEADGHCGQMSVEYDQTEAPLWPSRTLVGPTSSNAE